MQASLKRKIKRGKKPRSLVSEFPGAPDLLQKLFKYSIKWGYETRTKCQFTLR